MASSAGSEPEVLPYHNSVAVAGIEERFSARLAYPVAYHGEVLLGVQPHGYVVLALAVAKQQFGEAPVAALAHEAPAVDIERQAPVVFGPRHLAYARAEGGAVADPPSVVGHERHVVEILLAVAVGPPEIRIVHVHGRGEVARFARGEVLLDGERIAAELAGQHGRFLLARRVGHCRAHGHLRPGGVRQVEFAAEDGVADGQAAGRGDVHVAPYAYVAARHRGDPVPADGRVEGGVVQAQDAAVAHMVLQIHRMHFARVGVGDYPDCQIIAGSDMLSYVESGAGEGAFDEAQAFAVEPYFSLPVDAVEVQPHFVAHESRRHAELVPVPEFRVEIGFRNEVDVLVVGGLRRFARLHETGEDGAWDGGLHPAVVVEASGTDPGAVFKDFGGLLKSPVVAFEIQPRIAVRRQGYEDEGGD